MIKTTNIHVNPIKLDKLVHLQSLLHAILSYTMSGHGRLISKIDCSVLVTAPSIFSAYSLLVSVDR